MKLDVEFPVTFFPAHNEEPISLFIIHYFPEDESLTLYSHWQEHRQIKNPWPLALALLSSAIRSYLDSAWRPYAYRTYVCSYMYVCSLAGCMHTCNPSQTSVQRMRVSKQARSSCIAKPCLTFRRLLYISNHVFFSLSSTCILKGPINKRFFFYSIRQQYHKSKYTSILIRIATVRVYV